MSNEPARMTPDSRSSRSVSLDAELAAPKARRFRRRDQQPAAGADEETLQSLMAEVVLLREENARLKADRHQPAGLGDVLGRARALPAVGAHPDDLADEAAQMLVDGLVLRESLLEVCSELERAMAGVKVRLDTIGPSREATPPHDTRQRAGSKGAAPAAPPRAAAAAPATRSSSTGARRGKGTHGRRSR